MKNVNRKFMNFVLFIILVFIFCSCTVTIGPVGTNYSITIHNNSGVSITIEFSGGLPDYVILSGGTGTYSLPLNTIITARTTILPPLYFAVDDNPGQFNFTLDGAGYTLYAEHGCVNTYCLSVTRVL